MTEIIAVDIGGTHARFAIADVLPGERPRLGPETTLRTADHASLRAAWEAFAAQHGRPLPKAAGIAVAAPVGAETLKLTNNPWVIRPADLAAELGLEAVTLINDFGAVAHAVGQLGAEHLASLAGPDVPLPAEGVISVIGPGTGLGVAMLLRREGRSHVVETEGGHIDYAPIDSVEIAMLEQLRQLYGRVSVERIVSGPGLTNIHDALARIESHAIERLDDKALWALAIEGSDARAVAALDRFCLAFGAVAGDLALAHGATGVAIAGGVAPRIAERLRRSGFAERFAAKGRFAPRMANIPIRLVTHPQPGLLGAAAAFAEEHGS
jgi:glucokinase